MNRAQIGASHPARELAVEALRAMREDARSGIVGVLFAQARQACGRTRPPDNATAGDLLRAGQAYGQGRAHEAIEALRRLLGSRDVGGGEVEPHEEPAPHHPDCSFVAHVGVPGLSRHSLCPHRPPRLTALEMANFHARVHGFDSYEDCPCDRCYALRRRLAGEEVTRA